MSGELERVWQRFAQPLYQLALLCDPDAGRAAQAVIHAFRQQRWDDSTPLNQRAAELVRSLAPKPRWRWRSTAALGLPRRWWRLPIPSRLALGLRLVWGWSTSEIAAALGQEPAVATQTLLAASAVLAEHSQPLAPACQAFLAVRLDDPFAGRAHVLGCDHCRAFWPAWEQAETRFHAQLAAALHDHKLPPALLGQLQAAMSHATPAPPINVRLRTVGLLAAVLLLLGGLLLWPTPSAPFAPNDEPSTSRNARDLLAAAQRNYSAVPVGSGILHRRWAITTERPLLDLIAEEWIDLAAPSRHRLQITNAAALAEVQIANGLDTLTYRNDGMLAILFCGPMLVNTSWSDQTTHQWAMTASEQQAVRTARWQSGPWAVGLHYLQLAQHAATVRSLGVAGQGSDAVLTLAAEGPMINGTLLLRLDPASQTLREVRELRTDTGQLRETVPWRLLSSASVSDQPALWQIPTDQTNQAVRQHQAPLLDPACPLVGGEYVQSVPRVLGGTGGYGVVGLAPAPPELGQLMLFGERLNADEGYYRLDSLQSVYVGAGKRLVLWVADDATVEGDFDQPTGRWLAHLVAQAPGVWAGQAIPVDRLPTGRDYIPSYGTVRLWAEGFAEAELLAILAHLRPVGLIEWAQNPEHYYEPTPFEPHVNTYLRRVVLAPTQPSQRLQHVITRRYTRPNPPTILANTLPDPYHLRPPLEQRREEWIERDRDGRVLNQRVTELGPNDMLLGMTLTTPFSFTSYLALTNELFSTPSTSNWVRDDQATLLALRYGWQWAALPDGGFRATTVQPITQTDLAFVLDNQRRAGEPLAGTTEPWLLDLDPRELLFEQTWAADGSWRSSRTFAVAGMISLTPQRVLLTSDEVLEVRPTPSAAEVVRFVPPVVPPRPRLSEALYLEPAPDLATAVRSMSFPVLVWPRLNDGARLDRVLYLPTTLPDSNNVQPLANTGGMLIRLSYQTTESDWSLLQAPRLLLRDLMIRTPPLWIRSEQRTLGPPDTPFSVWIMHAAEDTHHWAAVEINETFVLLEYTGPSAGFEAFVQALPQLQPWTP